MKMSRHLKNKEENLLQKYFILNDSLQWWEIETNNTLDRIDFLEGLYGDGERSALRRRQHVSAMNELNSLLGRYKMECVNMDKLECEINNFLNQKRIIKNAQHR
tara:strand:+ start:93 stop:404 length:312 start_codon:yes stop_codon:yes gene_type:complete